MIGRWSISRPFDMYIYGHLVYFVVIWYIFHRFGMLYQEKSGNPDACMPLIDSSACNGYVTLQNGYVFYFFQSFNAMEKN
jgi:hypothetical protein